MLYNSSKSIHGPYVYNSKKITKALYLRCLYLNITKYKEDHETKCNQKDRAVFPFKWVLL